MKQTGGQQDQYAGAFGGINFLEFTGEKVKLTQLKLNKDFIRELEKRLVLVYTGKPHLATKTNKSMIDSFSSGQNTSNLIKIRDIAWEMKDALKTKRLGRFAELMNEETRNRAKLHRSVVPSKIQNIIRTALNNGAASAKVCGAGGGGSILFFCNDRKKLINKFKSSIIEFKFDFKGLRWL
jgi:D-glycero-alpha-D-manno-heptose-7-phosphate kinase